MVPRIIAAPPPPRLCLHRFQGQKSLKASAAPRRGRIRTKHGFCCIAYVEQRLIFSPSGSCNVPGRRGIALPSCSSLSYPRSRLAWWPAHGPYRTQPPNVRSTKHSRSNRTLSKRRLHGGEDTPQCTVMLAPRQSNQRWRRPLCTTCTCSYLQQYP